jgi:hypothetical protein
VQRNVVAIVRNYEPAAELFFARDDFRAALLVDFLRPRVERFALEDRPFVLGAAPVRGRPRRGVREPFRSSAR